MSKKILLASILGIFFSSTVLALGGKYNEVYRWTGSINSTWENNGNWVDASGDTPTNYPNNVNNLNSYYSIVIIDNVSNSPILTTDIEITSLIIKNGASLEISSGVDLEITHEREYTPESDYPIWDKVENNGAIIIGTSASMEVQEYFDNSGNITSNGTYTVHNIIKNYGEVYAPPTGNINLYNNLNNYTGGVITLESDATTTASLITDGAINNTGKINIERYIGQGTWQLLSSPTDNEVSELVNGSFLNYFNETDGEFYAVRAIDYSLVAGDGYVVKWKDEFSTGKNPLVFDNDKPNTGNISIPLSITPEEPNDPADGSLYSNTYFELPIGFNLVGNPYPSRINWNMLYNRNNGAIDASYYRYRDDPGNPGNGSWDAYLFNSNSPDSIINIGQGFGVVLSGNTSPSTLDFSDEIRTHNNGSGYGKRSSTISESFNLVASSNGMSDDVNFRLNKNSTYNYDGKFDAYKFNSFGNTPTPYFISGDNKRLAICQQPDLESVNLGFNMALSGEVTFEINNVQDFTKVVLEDTKEDTFTNLTELSYSFAYNNEDSDIGRFILHFEKGTLSEAEDNIDAKIYSSNSTVYINSIDMLNDVDVSLYDLSGQVVLSEKYTNLTKEEIETNLENGIYIIEVKSNEGKTVTKLNINTL